MKRPAIASEEYVDHLEAQIIDLRKIIEENEQFIQAMEDELNERSSDNKA